MAEKYSFIVVKYPQKETAEAALAVARTLAKEKVVKLKDAVAITKTEKGKIKLHQTMDDTAGVGFLKGGLVGVLLTVLLGPTAWIAASALSGTALALFDRGIKNTLLTKLGKEMTPEQSALAVLVESADWAVVKERMAAQNFQGEVVVSELVGEHLAEVEKLSDETKAVESVPQELPVEPEVGVAVEPPA